MATITPIRPSIGRIIGFASAQHAGTTSSFLGILATKAAAQSCPFSSTPERNMRRTRRDRNRERGVSSLYRSGPRFRMNMDKDNIPKPADFKPTIEVDPNHGLWDFFYSKEKLLFTPEEFSQHGRGWTVEELRHKSWDDLHKLWWVCIKERNRIITARKEKTRLKLRDGQEEIEGRLAEVLKTMRSIKHALTERWYVWEDARKLAETDPEIDLNNTNSPYTPGSYLEEDAQAAASPEAQQQEEPQQEGQQQEGLGEKEAAERVDPSTLPPSPTETQPPSPRV